MTDVTAADLMNRTYRHQRYFYDITRKYYLLGRDRLIARLNPRAGDSVLEIGCGTGRNLIVAARKYPNARFFGIDVSTEMLRSATVSIARAALSSRVQVAHADATRFDPAVLFARPMFERIFISYSLSMIPERRAVLEGVMSLLAPRGELHIIDFGGQEGLPRWFRSTLRRWLALFHVDPFDELETCLSACTEPLNARLVLDRPYCGYSQHASRAPDRQNQ